jgi:hypothetical protein
VFHQATYGGLTPYALNRLYAGDGIVELVGRHVEVGNRLYRFLGLWVDAEFGLVRWAPVLVLVLVATPRLEYGAVLRFARSRRRSSASSASGVCGPFRASGPPGGSYTWTIANASPSNATSSRAVPPGVNRTEADDPVPAPLIAASWLLPVATQVLVAVFLSITMRGWWFPGRMLIVVLPLLAIPLANAIVLARRRPALGVVAVGLAVYSVGITAALVRAAADGQVALAVDPFDLAWPPFREVAAVFPLYTEYSVSTLVLSVIWLGIALALIVAGGTWRRSRRAQRDER